MMNLPRQKPALPGSSGILLAPKRIGNYASVRPFNPGNDADASNPAPQPVTEKGSSVAAERPVAASVTFSTST